MNPFSAAFAVVVIEYRVKAGWSKAALAQKAGLHQTYISMLEYGERSPNILTAKAVADAFQVPLSRLVRAAERKAAQFGPEMDRELERVWKQLSQNEG